MRPLKKEKSNTERLVWTGVINETVGVGRWAWRAHIAVSITGPWASSVKSKSKLYKRNM